ncbi:MAG TPA: DUF1289 domain-containing protein [Casimicrobiaceae bacterium]|nr:DUF1289 domain-containing protein [Casimicrobiaceae bacterium]
MSDPSRGASPLPPLPPRPPAAVASPCISVCRMDDATGLCIGCLRTLDEIAAWGTLDDDARREVWVAIALRREASRHGGDDGGAG